MIKNTKQFMNSLLREDTFASFVLRKAVIRCALDIEIDGAVNRDFFEDEKDSLGDVHFTPWLQIRDTCFNLIRGRHTPLELKFILLADNAMLGRAIEVSGGNFNPDDCCLTLTIRFTDGHITLTTGTAISSFSLDKSLEKTWDSSIKGFLDAAGLDYDEQ